MIVLVVSVVFMAIAVPDQQVTCGFPPSSEHNDSEIGSEGCFWEDLEKEDFKCPLFIPKKMLPERVLQGNPKKLILAPRGFGKSTNLRMLQYYLSTLCTTKIKNLEHHVNLQDPHAVLYINLFAHETVSTHLKVYEILREKIHLSFLEHSYLIDSTKLNVREKDICERWASLRFVEMANHSVTMGWTHLCRFISRHWRPYKVFLLIDEFDSIVMNALSSASNVEFKLILSLLNGQLSKLVKYNDFVDRAVIMGESFVVGSELAASNDIEVFRFLGDHSMVDYFGFNDTEIDLLLTNKGLQNKRNDIFSWYGGYTSQSGQNIYNPYSVNRFLEENVFKSYWRQKGHVNSLLRFFQVSSVTEIIKAMLGYECASFTLIPQASGEDLMKLKAFIEHIPVSVSHQDVHDIFFTFLFDQGYFSFGRNDSSCIMIPNIEVDQELTLTLTQHYVQKHKLNPNMLRRSAKFFNKAFSLCSSTTVVNPEEQEVFLANVTQQSFKIILDVFFESVEDIFKNYQTSQGGDILNKDELTEVIFSLASYDSGFITKSKLKTEYLDEHGSSKKARIDLYMYKGSSAVIIELTHAKSKSPNSKAALQRILDRRYYNAFDNSVYTPKKIEHYLFVGLSTNNKGIISISGLLDSKNITEAVTVRKFLKIPSNHTRKKKFPSRKPTFTTTPVYINDSSISSQA